MIIQLSQEQVKISILTSNSTLETVGCVKKNTLISLIIGAVAVYHETIMF